VVCGAELSAVGVGAKTLICKRNKRRFFFHLHISAASLPGAWRSSEEVRGEEKGQYSAE
jgi:hypothetical protein